MPSSTSYISILGQAGGALYWYAQSTAGIHETLNGWLGQFVAEEVAPLLSAGLVQYDNAPAISPGASIHVLSEVRFNDTEHVAALGVDGNHYRKTGSLDLTVRGPIGHGDDAVLELAEDIRALVQGLTLPVNVEMRAPTALQQGREGGWFEVTASCPWWYDEYAARVATSGVGVNGDWSDTANVIRGRFEATVGAVPVTYDDAPPANPAGGIWSRFTVQQTATLRVETPAAYQTLGIATAQLFAPLSTGSGALYELSDTIYEQFRACADQGVVFGTANVRTVGRNNGSAAISASSDGWWQANVQIPFTAYQHAS